MIFHRKDAKYAKETKIKKGFFGLKDLNQALHFWFYASLCALRVFAVKRVLAWLRSRFEIRPVTRLELVRELADLKPWTQNEALIAVEMIARRGALFVMASPMLPRAELIAQVRGQAYKNLETHRTN